MTILDRKPTKYSTSDLFWVPSPAPTSGAIGDVNTMKLPASYLGMLQDAVIDTSGVLRNRGAVRSITSDTFAALCPVGASQTGVGTALMINDATSSYLYGTSAVALTGFAKLVIAGLTSTQDTLLSGKSFVASISKLADDSGAVIAYQTPYAGSSAGGAFLWGGTALTSNTSAGTASCTIGVKAVTGVGTAWTTALEGTFMYVNVAGAGLYRGQVAKVTSATNLTLKRGALFTNAGIAVFFKAARPVDHLIYKGRITTNTASTVVVGANTKFFNSAPGGDTVPGTYVLLKASLFRASDGAFVGTVSTIQNDTTLTLTANAAIALANEEYYLCSQGPNDVFSAINQSHYANTVAQYAGRFWYGGWSSGNTGVGSSATTNPSTGVFQYSSLNSVAFSKKGEPEMLDLDPVAGDIIPLPIGNNPDNIRAMYPTARGLVVLRTNDAFIITGYSPETFRVTKLVDDGTYNALSVVGFRNGVVWAGTKSVWFFDGNTVIDVLKESVGNFYQRSSKNINQAVPVGVATSNDYIMVSYQFDPNADRTWPSKNTTKTLDTVTLVINMLNGSISFFTNLRVLSSFIPKPVSTSSPLVSTILACNALSIAGSTGYLLDGSKLFLDSSTAADNFDALTTVPTFTAGAQIGPDVMFETVKLSNGNAARMKFWKMLLFNYSSDVGMTADFISLNDTTIDFPNRATGTVGVVTFPTSSNIGILKRVKFLIRTPALMIRVYQTNTTSAASQRFKLFWYAVGGKWMRWGRAQ